MTITKLFRRVKDSWLMDVRYLTDEQLKYDRNYWRKKFGMVDIDDEFYRYEDEFQTDVFTLAIMMEQLRRFGKIYYNKTNS